MPFMVRGANYKGQATYMLASMAPADALSRQYVLNNGFKFNKSTNSFGRWQVTDVATVNLKTLPPPGTVADPTLPADQQPVVYTFSTIHEWQNIYLSQLNPGVLGFLNSFIKPNSKSDPNTLSTIAGAQGLIMEAVKWSGKVDAAAAKTWANKAASLGASKYANVLGKGFGLLGAAATGFEGYNDADGFTFGDGIKVGIGIVTTFTPIGLSYGLLDLGVGLVTGTTITDRIGQGVDTYLEKK
jgi:hypothetical protein